MKVTENKVTLRILTPEDGYMLTDGKGVYAEKVYLGTLDSKDNWQEVTREEAEKAMASQDIADQAETETEAAK